MGFKLFSLAESGMHGSGSNNAPTTRHLFPLTAELYRRACLAQPIELETTNLSDFWICDSVPLAAIREQLISLLDIPYLSPMIRNNIILLCCNWLFWKESSLAGLKLMARFAPKIEHSEPRSALNFFGLYVQAQVQSGEFSQVNRNLSQAEKLLTADQKNKDLWVFCTRLSVVCVRANLMKDALFFARISICFAETMGGAIPLARSSYGLAYVYINLGAWERAVSILEPLLQGILAGNTWVEAVNKPAIPHLMARCYLAKNDTSNVERMLGTVFEQEMRIYGAKSL